MIRQLLVIVLLLQTDLVTITDAAAAMRSSRNSIDVLSLPYRNGKKKKFGEIEGCFCKGGCYQKEDLSFQTKCCQEICDGMELKGTTHDCAQNCPCYHSTMKYEKQLEVCQGAQEKYEHCTEKIRECSASSNQTAFRIEELTEELKKAKATIDIITKVWVPIGLLGTILITSLGFSCLMKWKMGKITANAGGDNCSLGASSDISSTKFQKNIWNQINNLGGPNGGNVNIYNQNNNSSAPGESVSSGSTLTPTNSTNSIGHSNSLPTSRSGSCHRGANLNVPIHWHQQVQMDHHQHQIHLHSAKNHPNLNLQYLPGVAVQRSPTQLAEPSGHHLPREGRGRERTPADPHHRYMLYLNSERRSSSMSKMANSPRPLYAAERDDVTPPRMRRKARNFAKSEASKKEALPKDLEKDLRLDLKEFPVPNTTSDSNNGDHVAGVDDDAEDVDVTQLKIIA